MVDKIRFYGLSLFYFVLIVIGGCLLQEGVYLHNHLEAIFAGLTVVSCLLSLAFEMERAKKLGIIGV